MSLRCDQGPPDEKIALFSDASHKWHATLRNPDAEPTTQAVQSIRKPAPGAKDDCSACRDTG